MQFGDAGVHVHDVARDVTSVPVAHETSVFPDDPGVTRPAGHIDQLPRRTLGTPRTVSGTEFALAETSYVLVDEITGEITRPRPRTYVEAVSTAADLAGVRPAPAAAVSGAAV